MQQQRLEEKRVDRRAACTQKEPNSTKGPQKRRKARRRTRGDRNASMCPIPKNGHAGRNCCLRFHAFSRLVSPLLVMGLSVGFLILERNPFALSRMTTTPRQLHARIMISPCLLSFLSGLLFFIEESRKGDNICFAMRDTRQRHGNQ